jgi:YbbR domain-containing protein
MDENSKNQKIVVKVCCVIASFVLWLYIFNVENPIRERKIIVPVQVINKDMLLPSKLVPIGEEQLSITLNIRGNASDIYSIKSEDFKLESDLSAYVVKKGENRVPVEVKRYPQNIRIANDESLWVTVTLDDLVKKIVPIKVESEGKTKEGFYALQPTLDIKEVEVSGPSQELNSINSVVAKCNINNVVKDINIVLPLQAENASGTYIKTVKIKPESVQVNIPVKKIKSVPVSVKTRGNLENGGVIISMGSLPEKIDIAGEEKVLSSINGLDTEPIDLSKLNGKDTEEAKLIVPKDVMLINSNGVVKVKVSYDKGIQKELNIDIQTRNIGNDYTVDLSNSKTTIVVSGLESVLNNLKMESIECFVDLNNLQEGEHVVSVVLNLPQGVSKLSQNPVNIKATIKKKDIGG